LLFHFFCCLVNIIFLLIVRKRCRIYGVEKKRKIESDENDCHFHIK